MASIKSNFTFHLDETDATADGNIYIIENGATVMNVEAISTGTAELVFWGLGELGVWRPMIGSKITIPMVMCISSSDLSTFYQLDLTGTTKVKIALNSNSGSTTVVGKIWG